MLSQSRDAQYVMCAAADSDSAEVTASLETGSVTVSPESDDTASDSFDGETNEDAVDKHSSDHSAAHVERSDAELAVIANCY